MYIHIGKESWRVWSCRKQKQREETTRRSEMKYVTEFFGFISLKFDLLFIDSPFYFGAQRDRYNSYSFYIGFQSFIEFRSFFIDRIFFYARRFDESLDEQHLIIHIHIDYLIFEYSLNLRFGSTRNIYISKFYVCISKQVHIR